MASRALGCALQLAEPTDGEAAAQDLHLRDGLQRGCRVRDLGELDDGVGTDADRVRAAPDVGNLPEALKPFADSLQSERQRDGREPQCRLWRWRATTPFEMISGCHADGSKATNDVEQLVHALSLLRREFWRDRRKALGQVRGPRAVHHAFNRSAQLVTCAQFQVMLT